MPQTPRDTAEPFDGRLGASIRPGEVQFAVHAAAGGSAELLLFDDIRAARPARTLRLDPVRHRTASYWHIRVPGVGHGQVYNWRLNHPDRSGSATGGKTLLDPYGFAIGGFERYDRAAAHGDGDNTDSALRSVVVDPARYDWQDDAPPPPPAGREFIYELHVAGFTADPSSGLEPDLRGTYAGLAAKASHLVALGVTTVELMPVHAYDPQDAPSGRVNYWGYSPVSYFAPHPGYAGSDDPAAVLDEFRDMVRSLHAAGLKVVLDVVYNHTAEGGPEGPVLSWRGFDEAAYYMREADFDRYRDFTGCGNTVNANHPVTSRMITDSLRHWVTEFHIDGFRFDLAAALARGEDGELLAEPPVLRAIDTDPLLAGTRLIAEAWDAGGLQLVADFPGRRFAVWNGPFRDTTRRFLRGDPGQIEELMARIVGSRDLLQRPDDRPSKSINFVTCHDGFTLRDLVSYEQKVNAANGENNRDGSGNNLSWNSGFEGPTDEPAISALRARRQRNFITLLLFSHGTPMLLAGDEWGHSRQGNNNPWNLDGPPNWLDWNLADANADLLRFVRRAALLANGLPSLCRDRFWRATSPDRTGDISWHGLRPGLPDWTRDSHHLGYEFIPPSGDEHVLVLLNAGASSCEFQLAAPPVGTTWQVVIDTSATPPTDCPDPPTPRQPIDRPLAVPAHTVVVLLSRR